MKCAQPLEGSHFTGLFFQARQKSHANIQGKDLDFLSLMSSLPALKKVNQKEILPFSSANPSAHIPAD